MMQKLKDYYSSREAANLLGVAVSTIQLWVNDGQLKAWTTSGGHRRISRNSVEEMLRAQREAMGVTDDVAPFKEAKLPNIMIVEDDDTALRLYQKFIKSWNIDVLVSTAKDGYEGLFKIGKMVPDIILTDLVMPNMDGVQMLRMLEEQSINGQCAIIVITGLSDSDIEDKGGLPKGIHLLRKPVNESDLKKLVFQRLEES